MKNRFTLVLLILISYLVTGKLNAKEFNPYLILKETELGEKLIILYDKAEAEPDEVFIKLNTLMQKNELSQTPLYQFAYYRIIYIVEMARSRPDKAEAAINNLYHYAIETDTLWLKAEAQMWQSTFLSRRGEYLKAHTLLEKVISTAQKTQFNRLLARAYNTRAIVHSFQNKRYLEKKDYLSALAIFENYPADPYLSKVTSNVSVLFQRTSQWEKAIYYNEKARLYYNKTKYPSNLQKAILHSNAANIYREKNDLESKRLEIEHLDIAHKFAQKSGELYIQNNILAEYAQYYLKEGNFQLAKQNAIKCIEAGQTIKTPLIKAQCTLIMGEIHLQKGHLLEAEELMLKSKDMFNKTKNVTWVIPNYQQLSLLYKQWGNFEKAYQYATL